MRRRLLVLPLALCIAGATLAAPASAGSEPTGERTHLAVMVSTPEGVDVRRIAVEGAAEGEALIAELRSRSEVIAVGWDVSIQALDEDLDSRPALEVADGLVDEATNETDGEPVDGSTGGQGPDLGEEPGTGTTGEQPDGTAGEPVEEVEAPSDGPGAGTIEEAPLLELDDPARGLLWGLDYLKAEESWTKSSTNPLRAGEGVTVAVLDTGVDGDHPDFQDADGSSVVLEGYDFVADQEGGNVDPNGHGTHVAGSIAAVANNGIGIAGLAPGVRILPVRVLSADGTGPSTDVAEGIIWAAENGADVINLSLGARAGWGAYDGNPIPEAIKVATGHGALVVAAAGNEGAECGPLDVPGEDCGNPLSWPASLPLVESVAALNHDGTTADFSQHNPYVDLTAPGVCILSLAGGTMEGEPECAHPATPEGYVAISGTSMAAPHVAAVAAVTKAHWEGKGMVLNPQALGHHLRVTARDLGATGRDDYTGNGAVDLLAALTVEPLDQNLGAPRITVPADLVVKGERMEGGVGAIVNYLDQVSVEGGAAQSVVSGDSEREQGAGIMSAHCFPLSGRAFPMGVTTVSCTAVDGVGEVGYASFKVNVTGPENSTPIPRDNQVGGYRDVTVPVPNRVDAG